MKTSLSPLRASSGTLTRNAIRPTPVQDCQAAVTDHRDANHGLPGAPLSTAEFRRLGHRVIDAIVDHWEGLDEARPITTGRADELRARLAEPPPAGPTAPDAVIDQVLRDV